MYAPPRRLVGADDREVLVDEDVVRPVDADVVDLVLAVAQLHNTVDDAELVPFWFVVEDASSTVTF
jgi:hypothetical protein